MVCAGLSATAAVQRLHFRFSTVDGMARLLTAFAALAVAAGCIHTQLTKNSHGVTESLADVHQQQVLDNLAMFASDLGALPYFAYASQGTASVNDQSGLSATNLLTRQCQEQWQFTSVNDPRKLELMRCVYQRVVALHRSAAIPADCPNCERLLRKFYSGDPEIPVEHAGLDSVTVDCLTGERWLAMGCGKCAKKRRGSLMGRYGDVWVWVLPGKRDELTKLTLIILDYALHDPASKPKKSAALTSNDHGSLAGTDNRVLNFTGDAQADDQGH